MTADGPKSAGGGLGGGLSWGCGPIDQWRSNIGDVGSEIVLACTHRVAIVTRQPAGRNDGHPHMSCCRQLTVKYMRMSNVEALD